MAFNSSDTAAFKGVWVFCEQREGVIMSTSYQLLSEGRKLANDLGVELCGVVLGKDIKEEYLKALGGYGADKVYYCNHELLDVYTTDAYTKVTTPRSSATWWRTRSPRSSSSAPPTSAVTWAPAALPGCTPV